MGQVIVYLPFNCEVIAYDDIQQKGVDMRAAKKALYAGKTKQGSKCKKAAVGMPNFCAMYKKK